MRGPGIRGGFKWGVSSTKPKEKTAQHNGECAGCGIVIDTCNTCGKDVVCGERVWQLAWASGAAHAACGWTARGAAPAKAGGT